MQNVINFRNENKGIMPNYYELMDITVTLNNKFCQYGRNDELVKAYNVLHKDVQTSFETNIDGAKDTNLYNLFETMKENMGDTPIKGDSKSYLCTISGVSLFQIEQAKNGNMVSPNSNEKDIIADFELEDLPEYARDIASNVALDIQNPQQYIQREENVK